MHEFNEILKDDNELIIRGISCSPFPYLGILSTFMAAAARVFSVRLLASRRSGLDRAGQQVCQDAKRSKMRNDVRRKNTDESCTVRRLFKDIQLIGDEPF